MATTLEEVAYIIWHIEKIRSFPGFQDMPVILFIEANHDMVRVNDVRNYLASVKNIYIPNSNAMTDSPGVFTTHKEKEYGVQIFGAMLKTNQIRWSKALFTHSGARMGETIRQTPVNQLRNYEKKEKASRNGQRSIEYTGKKKVGQVEFPDDLATASILGVFWIYFLWTVHGHTMANMGMSANYVHPHVIITQIMRENLHRSVKFYFYQKGRLQTISSKNAVDKDGQIYASSTRGGVTGMDETVNRLTSDEATRAFDGVQFGLNGAV